MLLQLDGVTSAPDRRGVGRTTNLVVNVYFVWNLMAHHDHFSDHWAVSFEVGGVTRMKSATKELPYYTRAN